MVSLLMQALFHVSILLWAVSPTASDTCTGGYSGVPGIPGTHGANGLDGPKGEKGEPGQGTQTVEGQKGDLGIPGYPGRRGLRGDEGIAGFPGPKGPKGQKGSVADVPEGQRSFFSYKRSSNLRSNLVPHNVIEFDYPLSGKNADEMSKGVFTAKLSGVYFFVYHITATQTACIYIKKEKETLLNLCDTSQGVLVTSGSVVLRLNQGESVSLYSTRLSQIVSKEADSIFTGFLLFPS